jgi:hypothetical protein
MRKLKLRDISWGSGDEGVENMGKVKVQMYHLFPHPG